MGEMGVKVPLLITTTDSVGRFGETEIESEISRSRDKCAANH